MVSHKYQNYCGRRGLEVDRQIAAREVRGSNLGLGRKIFHPEKLLIFNFAKKFVTPAKPGDGRRDQASAR